MMIYTWQILLAAVAGWVNSELRDVNAYIMEENKVLQESLVMRADEFWDSTGSVIILIAALPSR